MQDTSLYAWIELQPVMGDRQLRVIDALESLKAASNKEISAYLGIPINCVTPRVKELRMAGRIVCLCGSPHLTKDPVPCMGARPDPVRLAKVWQLLPRRWSAL